MKELPQNEKREDACFPITVAVVTYNHGKKLKACIDSIAKQTYKHIDLVIVDDYSCDFNRNEVEAYVKSLDSESIQTLSIEAFDEHRGVNAAYRHALELAKGEYILFLGGDDFLADKTVISKAALALQDKKADVLQARAQLLREGEEIIIPSQQCIDFVKQNKIFDLTRVTIIHPFSQLLCIQSAFFNVKTLLENGCFCCDYQFAVDWPLYLKLLFEKVEVANLDLLTTLMNDGGAYRGNSVGNLYIKKGYLADAQRAIREYAVEKRAGIAQKEALMFETAANSYQAYSTRTYDWYYYTVADKLAWKRKHKNLYLTHKACYPNFGKKSLPIKKIVAAIAMVYALISAFSMLPMEHQMWNTAYLLPGVLAIAGLLVMRNGANLNYQKLFVLLMLMTGVSVYAKKYETIYIPSVLLIVLAVLFLTMAFDICHRLVYKLYCRYARKNYGKE